MKITHVTTRVLDTLDETPLVAGLPEPGEHTGPRQLLTVELGTDQGLVGLGVTFWHGALAPALKVALDVLAERTLGEDPRAVEAIASKLRGATGRTSVNGSGIFHHALAAIDMACWDLKAKLADQSLCAFLGSARQRVPAYASGALLRGFSLDALQRAADALVRMGFGQLKMQCGSEATPAASIDRVRAVREAIGPGVDLMWRANTAPACGRFAICSRRGVLTS